jgi:hypothetical protein
MRRTTCMRKKAKKNSKSQLLVQNSWIAQIEIGRTRGRTNEKEKKIDKQIKAYIANGTGCKQPSSSALYSSRDKQTEKKRESSWNHVNYSIDFIDRHTYIYKGWAQLAKEIQLVQIELLWIRLPNTFFNFYVFIQREQHCCLNSAEKIMKYWWCERKHHILFLTVIIKPEV